MVSKITIVVCLSFLAAFYVYSHSESEKLDEKTLLGMTALHMKKVSDHVSNSTIANHEITKKVVGHVNNAVNAVSSHDVTKKVVGHVNHAVNTVTNHEVTKKVVGHVSHAANTVSSHVVNHSGHVWEKVNSDQEFHKKIDSVVETIEKKANEANQKMFDAVNVIKGHVANLFIKINKEEIKKPSSNEEIKKPSSKEDIKKTK